jgi:Rieske Fe-S protein
MDVKRRRFCQAGGGLMLASAILPSVGGCGGGGTSMDAGTSFYAGTTDEVPVGQAFPVPLQGAMQINVCHDANGFYALAGNCTHASCVLLFADVANPTGFACPCHMSTFDFNGQNPTGPAMTTGPLKHFKVTLDGNKIYVDISMTVDPTVRVM